jgi:alginate O-acetyltransferase complex protein AlgI
MIFNTWDYYLLFLLPSALLFRVCSPRWRPWVVLGSGSLFFLYFSYTQLGGIVGAAGLGIFLWESLVSRWYKPGSWFCAVGIIQTILFLAVFKYRNFLTSLIWTVPAHNPFYWRNAFLPLGISFFTFEFLHYAIDRYKGRTEGGQSANIWPSSTPAVGWRVRDVCGPSSSY